MSINLNDKLKLRKLIKQLKSYRGRHTELITVYLPPKSDLTKLINTLQDEQGTASNIKDKNTGKSVISALERMIRTLKTLPKTPEHGLAIFSGNISEKDNVDNFQVFWLEPPEPVPLKLYRCEQRFVTEPLEEMDSNETKYGLIAIDKGEATVGVLIGSTIKVVRNMNSTVPGKFKTGGQCLTQKSLIQMCDGSLKQIKDIKVGEKVKSMNFNNYSLIDSTITDKWIVPKKETLIITTKAPKLEIKCSKDHVLFIKTQNGVNEIAAQDLKKGDKLIIPEKINISNKEISIDSSFYYNEYIINDKGKKLLIERREKLNLTQKQLAKKLNLTQTTISSYEIGKINVKRLNLKKLCYVLKLNKKNFLKYYCEPSENITLPKKINNDFAQILGYFIGDGNFEKERLNFSENREELALIYETLLKKTFNCNTSIKNRKEKGYYQIRAYGKSLIRLLKNEFIEIKQAKDSLIPQKIFQSPTEILGYFLKGLFDAEGYISRRRVGIGMNNKLLITQIQNSLLRFGIISSIHVYDNRKNPYSNNYRYTIDISEKESLIKFKEYINFTALEKQEKLLEAINKKSYRSHIRQILSSGTEVRNIIKNANKNLELFPSVSGFFNNSRKIGKKAFKKSILGVLPEGKLKNNFSDIYSYNALPLEIDKIKIKKEESEMIDISVENQNFIANGLIVHNSAQRFERIREGAAVEFYKRVGDVAIQEFTFMKELKGIIVGGPGTTKNNFVDGSYMNEQIKQKVLGVKDITYTNAFGLKELVDKAQDLLSEDEVMTEKRNIQELLEKLAKQPDFIVYGYENTKLALEMNAVDKLILIDDVVTDEELEELSTLAEASRCEIILVTDRTPEGVQFKGITGIGGILRFPIHS